MVPRRVLVLATLLGCDDDGPGASDASTADASTADAPPADAGPTLTHVTWEIRRVGGEPGCAPEVDFVGLSGGGWPDPDLLFDCAAGEAWVDLRHTVVAIAHRWNLLYVGGAHVNSEDALTEAHLVIHLTDEPGGPLSRLAARVTDHLAEHGALPAPAQTTFRDCCSEPDGLCADQDGDWADFSELGFRVEGPRRYDYRVEPGENTIVVTAEADFDCDRVPNDVSLLGVVVGPDEIVWSAPFSERINE
jgi:hypothetical protein